MSKDFDVETNKEIIQKIRPHYIFNVLWNIEYLYKHDAKAGEKMLVDFSSFLRGKINDLCYEGLISFEDEFEATQAYIEIEQVRSSNGIKADYDFQFTDFEIPPLIMQPLVENALKHGIFPKESQGYIKIGTAKENGQVVIYVEDDGVGFDVNALDKEKCGNLFKIEERMKKHYPDAKVEIDSTIGKGTKVTIRFTA